MQDFVCPRCGHKSTFDPWKESAHCPHCGYRPSPEVRIHKQLLTKQWATHQPFLDELLAYWGGRHTPDLAFTVPTSDMAVSWFRDYQRALGEDPDLRPGRHVGYVRNYHPQRDEVVSFVRAYLWLKRGERAAAARQLRDLTARCPVFADPWIWLSATTDEASERQASLGKAVILEPAHPLAQDALAILQGRVSPAHGNRRLPLEHELMLTNCPRCGAPTHYEASATEVVCEYCGHQLDLPRTNLLEEKARLVSDLRLRRRHEGHTWDEIQRVVHCESCGARLTMTHHLVRTCLYCGSTNVIVEDSQSTLEQPDGFLPFEISEEQASSAISQAQRSGLRRLKVLLTRKGWEVEELQGIYLPFWVFDGFIEVRTWVEEAFQGISSGQRELDADTMMFSNLLFPAVDVPPPHILEQVLPYDLHALVPYEPRLLADRAVALYSLDVEEVADQACDAMIAMARERTGGLLGVAQRTPTSADSASNTPIRLRRSYQVSGTSYQLVLLPVWLAQVRSGDERSLMVVSGQSGKLASGPSVTSEQ
jgi:DNA-directed RNA polymerase subunit RPC12/RpoP/predicted RNA-binding Zn-ribbon protein involved in translation (DUF1610 family)